MKLMKQTASILKPDNGKDAIRCVEYAGRNCYRSQDKITEGSAERFVKGL